MHLVGQRTLGIAILALLAVLVIVKRATTGSIMRDTPSDGIWLWLVHAFNLFFLLAANPLAGVLLVMRRFETFDPTRVILPERPFLFTLEMTGGALCLAGFSLIAWALTALRGSYQAGGTAPRAGDEMTVCGSYRLVRHPMYLAAPTIALGLACLVQSMAFLAVFCVHVATMFWLVTFEEAGLRRSYGDRYLAYQEKVHRLIPFLL